MADHHRDDAAILAGLEAKYASLVQRRERLERLRGNIDRDIRQVIAGLTHLSVTSRLFGGDLPMPPGATSMPLAEATARVRAALERAALRADQPVAPQPAPSQGQHKIKDLVLDRLKVASDRGTRAAEIRQFIAATYGMETHEKTVGMTLYRLLKRGLARREGVTWFFVPPEAEKKNPGAGTPGQRLIDLD